MLNQFYWFQNCQRVYLGAFAFLVVMSGLFFSSVCIAGIYTENTHIGNSHAGNSRADNIHPTGIHAVDLGSIYKGHPVILKLYTGQGESIAAYYRFPAPGEVAGKLTFQCHLYANGPEYPTLWVEPEGQFNQVPANQMQILRYPNTTQRITWHYDFTAPWQTGIIYLGLSREGDANRLSQAMVRCCVNQGETSCLDQAVPYMSLQSQ